MKHLLPLVLTLIYNLNSTAQYTYYQDATQAELYDNPSFAGADSTLQARLNYNNTASNIIGGNAYQQAHLYLDKGIVLKNKDLIGIGVGANRDVAGESRFGVTAISLLGAYHKQLSSNTSMRHYLSLGTGLSFSRQHLGDGDLRWPSQIDPNTGFDPAIPSGEELATVYYLGVDLGLSYSARWQNKQFATVGIAIQDINQPNLSFYDESDAPLGRTTILSMRGRLNISAQLYTEPSIRYITQAQGSLVNIGNSLGYHISERSSVMLGLATHDHSRYSVNVGTNIRNTRIMLIYGWTGSGAFAAKAYELAVGYGLR